VRRPTDPSCARFAPARTARGLAGQPERHDGPVLAPCPQVAANQLGHAVHAWTTDVGHQAGGLAKRKFYEPVRYLAGVDRLEADLGWDRYHRQLGHLPRRRQHQIVELGRAQRGPREAGVRHGTLRAKLCREVAEHRAVDSTDYRDPVGANDRDVHEVARPAPRRCPDQVQSLLLVALGAARAVHDDLGPLHRGFDALAGGQITCHELDALAGLMAMPAEHSYLAAAGVAQPRDDEAAQGPGAAGDQDGTGSGIASSGACRCAHEVVPSGSSWCGQTGVSSPVYFSDP
jgi:hypothetical protein